MAVAGKDRGAVPPCDTLPMMTATKTAKPPISMIPITTTKALRARICSETEEALVPVCDAYNRLDDA